MYALFREYVEIIKKNFLKLAITCSKLTIKTLEQGCSGVFIVNFERILHVLFYCFYC